MNVTDRPPATQEPDEISRPEVPPPRRSLFVIVVVVALALLARGVFKHMQSDKAAAETQRETVDFVPTVRVAPVKLLAGPVKLTLPGNTLAFAEARIFARATGYIAERRVDIGSRVHTGDLLARIAAPELDQQLAQAQAQLAQMRAALLQAQSAVEEARSNMTLADVTNTRTSQLAVQGWETKQNADNTRLGLASRQAAVNNAEAGVKVAAANLAAQYATVQRLQQLTAYESVTAPFDGVVTARNIDTGDLVSADANGGTPLFTLQREDVLRVQVYVPQSGVIGLKPGVDAHVQVPELPGRTFDGRVARLSEALDAGSRTMLAEADVPNPDGTLRPGLYVSVTFDVPRTTPGVVIPAEALLFNADGLRVATVDNDGHVAMREVAIYRDFGTTLELRAGLKGDERVALSPPADIKDGQQVKIAPSS
jgi:HlyD family secretion protein